MQRAGGGVSGVSGGIPDMVLTETPTFFYSCSPIKLFLLGGLSFNFYSAYWFWSQWRTEDPCEGRGWVLFRTLFSPFFFYSMANQVEDEAVRQEVAARYSPVLLTGILWSAVIATRVFPDPIRIAAVWLFPVPLFFLQRSINEVNWTAGRIRNAEWRWWETAMAGALGAFWLMGIVGFLIEQSTS
jgi:hypothetical protein